MNKKLELVESVINFVFFIVGVVGVWTVTHNALAIWWTVVASAHWNLKKFLEDRE